MGRGTREGPGSTHNPGTRKQRGAGAWPRQFNQQPDSPLPQAQGDSMTPRGFDRPLYIQPFDHRGSFETGMFGWKGALTPEQTAQIADAKQVIYDGFKAAVDQGVPKD